MVPSDDAVVAAAVLRCSGCGAVAAPPRQLCPCCHRATLVAGEAPGLGTLLSWTVIRRPPLTHRELGSYAVCVVDLDCGICATGRLAGIEDLPEPGARVRCVAREGAVPIFRRDA
jgi:uncharacterized OB-fold protein